MEDLNREFKLKPVQTESDGHCLLYAVAHQLHSKSDNRWHYQSLKSAVKNESMANENQYTNFIDKKEKILYSEIGHIQSK
jgi:hypothetical protein